MTDAWKADYDRWKTTPDDWRSDDRKEAPGACEGGETISNAWDNMVECRECGMRVRWDLAEHPFYGFEACCGRRVGP